MNDATDPGTKVGDVGNAVFIVHADAAQWARSAAAAIAVAVSRDLDARPRARLLLSGGTTPAPVYSELSKVPLDWARVDVALVDERWLLPDDADSNARLVRGTLLHHHAAAARFEPMTRAGLGFEDTVSTANMHARHPAGVVVLGMGPDGHTASLFPGMRGLDAALAATTPYVAVDASGCAGAGRWPRRISLTPAGLAPAPARILLIRGHEKRALYEHVRVGGDVHDHPVRIAFTTPGAVLHTHWCP